jgi:CRISPR/Cas system CMR subunit Cmr4 (Cas7 group RAMP superfamily)
VELTIIVDSPVFKTISKTITIQVHGSNLLFDNAGIALKNEFHKAGANLDAAIYISGKNQSVSNTEKTYLDSADFQYIKNVDITWKVTNKKGEEIAKRETVTRDNSEKSAREVIFKDNASMTLTNPDSDDYTITAYYQGEVRTIFIPVEIVE